MKVRLIMILLLTIFTGFLVKFTHAAIGAFCIIAYIVFGLEYIGQILEVIEHWHRREEEQFVSRPGVISPILGGLIFWLISPLRFLVFVITLTIWGASPSII